MKDITIEDERNKVDANNYINRAIQMLKEDYDGNQYTAGYNGVLSLLQYAKESHAASLKQIECCGAWVKASERLPLKEDQYFIYVPTLTMKKVSTFNGRNFEHQFTNNDFEWYDDSSPCKVDEFKKKYNEGLRLIINSYEANGDMNGRDKANYNLSKHLLQLLNKHPFHKGKF